MNMKAKLVQGGDGTAIPANYVGEVKTWATPASTQALTVSEADWGSTDQTITLTTGRWQIFASIQIGVVPAAASGAYAAAFSKLTDSSNNLIDNCFQQTQITTSANVAATHFSVQFLTTVVNIPEASKTFKIRVYKSEGGGTSTCTAYNQNTAYSKFYAVRLPG